MKIKVNTKELKPVIETLNSDTNYLIDKLNYLNDQVKELRTVWIGEDSDIFCNNAEDYLNHLKSVPKIYDALSRVMEEEAKTPGTEMYNLIHNFGGLTF